MSKSSHTGTGDMPQNQNNAMSDDPGDGQRNSFTAKPEATKGLPGAPEKQDEDKLEELGSNSGQA